MSLSAAGHPRAGSIPNAPGPQRLRQLVLAAAIVGGPLAFLAGGVLAPSIHDTGQSSIAANAVANPTANTIHLAATPVTAEAAGPGRRHSL